MPLTKVKEKLEEAIGLNVDSIGMTALEGAVLRRLSAINLETFDDYVSHLLTDSNEIKHLIEEIVVPETWFFRDKSPFTAVGEYARKRFTSDRLHLPLRILTMPSATGEEPYSVAITLFEYGFTSAQFSVDAIDISKKALGVAGLGIYGKNSFRGEQDSNLLNKYFVKLDKNFKISDQVKEQVIFRHGNILNLDQDYYSFQYDIIFCRNLLIYFDKNNKNKAFNVINGLLKEKGLLLLGHAETAIVNNNFIISGYEKSFSFIKDSNANQKKSAPENKPLSSNKKPILSRIKKKTSLGIANNHNKKESITANQVVPIKTKEKKRAVPTPESGERLLRTAKELADIGELNKAKDICIEFLKSNRSDSQCYFLLGLIAVASEEMNLAEEYLRKSIYINPKHYDALIHLSFLLEKSGDMDGADRLRKRANKSLSV